ncbi:MAG: cysteine--tRNA ligase [Deltaproteobacteria bacterium]|nr:cysteine--tRNA ligase [Deltaproteobacteria bacterium]
MSLRFYNTLTRQKEDFMPRDPGAVGMYVCGITAYDVCHVGHARSAVVFDVIYRYLKYRGYNVNFVKNFTDVDDKIIARAASQGLDIFQVSDRFIKKHNDDMDRLGVSRPTVTPKATENIKGMIRLISTLLEKGFAYSVEGDVYFSVESFPNYGRLSGRRLEDMEAGARVEIDERKRNPYDFALWKSSKEGEPWWDSPWGRGRPGWHIECSVMSQRYLGDTFDIHGGGEDLIFPHHENEIAQSEAATGKPFARYWIHNGFIKVDNEKMSKSLGNVCSIEEILEKYHPEVLRLFILQSHYRSYIDFTETSLQEARAGLERFYAVMKGIKDALSVDVDCSQIMPRNLSGLDHEIYEKIETLPERFVDSMDDDFNTARALGCLFDVVRLINGYFAELKSACSPESLFVLAAGRSTLKELGKVLGLLADDPDDYFIADRNREVLKRGLDVAAIESLIAERSEARTQKNWGRADEIRKSLAERGVILKDSPTETLWSVA